MPPETQKSWADAFRASRPHEKPSVALLERVSTLAAVADAQHVSDRVRLQRRRWISGIAATAIVGVAALGASIIGPRIALAHTLRTVSFNLGAAHGYHCLVTMYSSDRTTMKIEWWYSGGNWREQTYFIKPSGQQTTPTMSIAQDKHDGKVTYYHNGSLPIMTPSRRDTSNDPIMPNPFLQMLQHIQTALVDSRAENRGTVSANGQSLQLVAIDTRTKLQPVFFSNPKPGRSLFWIDTNRMLPVAMEEQENDGGKWTTRTHIDFDFDRPIPPSTFQIPRTYRKTLPHLRALGAKLGHRFAVPIAQAKIGNQEIAVRDAQVNSEGDIFLLYTNGSTPTWQNKDLILDKVADDSGRAYLENATTLSAFEYRADSQESLGMTIDNEAIQSANLTPLHHAATDSNPQSLSLFFGSANAHNAGTLCITVPVKQTKGLFPDYESELAATLSQGVGDIDSAQYRQLRAQGREFYFEKQHDWNGLLQECNDSQRSGGNEVGTDLTRARAYAGLERWAEAHQALADAKKHASHNTEFYARVIAPTEAYLKAAEAQSHANPLHEMPLLR